MKTENKKPIVVSNEVSADEANKMYGDNYGSDWVYEELNKEK